MNTHEFAQRQSMTMLVLFMLNQASALTPYFTNRAVRKKALQPITAPTP
jgi:hypothetical protein